MNQTLRSLRFRLTKRFGAKTVLDDFALEVQGRQFVTLLGPSGCGKSTALNIVAGLLPASAGEVFADGERIDTLPPEQRGFGMVFQNYALFPHMTVFGNVAFGLELQGRPKAEIRERVHKMLALVQLPGFEDRYPSQLSGGQQQRVAIARALIMHPRLLLLDEPLSNLDAKLRVEMRAEIKRIHANLGLTCIYVTHDQTEALSLSDWIVVMRNGIVMQAGLPNDIYNRPNNPFVADFMGFRNFFQGSVSAIESNGMVKCVSGPLRIKGTARHGPAAGAKVVAAIRPEDVLVNAASGANQFRGKVEIVEYLGRDFEAVVAMEGGLVLWIRTAARLAVGEQINVAFPPDKVIVLPADPDGAAS